ncbi:GGDEF domain-containing protein [Pelagerythrobacter sp.]|uniref:GGDEF domain-containing protein n=1 Tax=Pelagerythrobacter sp. TaxID=2800702 RepID=UPI0035B179C9
MDVFTLFGANAIILLVMALGFLAAYARRRENWWPAWIAANLVLALALLLFITLPGERSWLIAIPNTLLAIGFGLRWRAAHLFTASPTGWMPVWLPACAVIGAFALPQAFGAGTVFALVNVILGAQASAIAWHFWRERAPASFSSHGLVAAYAVMALSFGMRVIEGIAFFDGLTTYFPLGGTLPFHLVIAVVHTSASGAFALSIAYERTALQMRDERDSAQRQAQDLGRLAERDALTGLLNRRAIEPRFAELRAVGFSALAVVDLDHFKRVNDAFGHLRGDEALRAVAAALAPDEDCLAARMGGEEFILLLRGDDARGRVEARRQAIARRVAADIPGLPGVVTASVGLVELPREGLANLAFAELYAAADRLLYDAKSGGRNRLIAERLSLFAAPAPRTSTEAA